MDKSGSYDIANVQDNFQHIQSSASGKEPVLNHILK